MAGTALKADRSKRYFASSIVGSAAHCGLRGGGGGGVA
jgi:hypothetical protein